LGLADLREGSALALRPHCLPHPSDAPGRECRERGREGGGGRAEREREGGRDRERDGEGEGGE
jgi:hypothetical protein